MCITCSVVRLKENSFDSIRFDSEMSTPPRSGPGRVKNSRNNFFSGRKIYDPNLFVLTHPSNIQFRMFNFAVRFKNINLATCRMLILYRTLLDMMSVIFVGTGSASAFLSDAND